MASLVHAAGLAGAEYTKPNPVPGSRPRGKDRPIDSAACMKSFTIRVVNTDPDRATAPMRADVGTPLSGSTRHKCTLEAGHDDVHECNHGHQS